MTPRYPYRGDAVRLKGGTATIHSHEAALECRTCGGRIRAGELFTVGPYASDRPVCATCQPFNQQEALFGDLPEPQRGRGTPPAHLTMEDYRAQDGRGRRRRQCVPCNGKGWSWDAKWVSGREVEFKKKCEPCDGHGYLWDPI